MSDKPPCTFDGFERDEQGCYPMTALVVGTKDCTVPAGACFSSSTSASVADDPPTPPPQPRRRPKKHPMSDTPTAPVPSKIASDRADDGIVPDSHADDFVPAAPAPAPVAAPVAHTVADTTTAASEVAALLPKDGSGGTGATVLLTLIAVGGGGAAWKFYQSFAKQKHDEPMKELSIKEKKLTLQDDNNDHKACEAARASDRAALEAKIAALETRLAAAEAEKPALPELPFDADELQNRIAQIEAALKKDAAPKKRKT